jgi:copper chaperone
MKKYQFKTNIMCAGCIQTVKPFLDKNSEISTWEVDLQSPDKILTVESAVLSEEPIKSIVNKAGYKAEIF